MVSIRVIAGSTLTPTTTEQPALRTVTVSDHARVRAVTSYLNALTFNGGFLPCPADNHGYLELDFFSAGHPRKPSATAIVHRTGCNGVLASESGHLEQVHQGAILDQVLAKLGLPHPAR
ncbi:hypothetical protein ACFY0P_48570 [Streptomyces sp. NPDC001714]|uniref:hypothetical protein n=1 Tax=Streptomyces sp. NPDC001714 TaxID=3364603 RepID=UPI00368A771A